MVKQSRKISREEAERLTTRCLAHLASSPEALGGFLAATGLGPENLRAAARDERFLSAVITYVNEDDRLLIDCAAALDVPPERLAECYEAIVGSTWFEEP